ncbi:P-loop containing nucleoside triphosphate hydrolase protein [Glomus cerebriforme]|uniref:P-loop containing nucleoside triphosphate hydrolase protein n=1 Tax=Glomus cerebriforme TaxID=658196 RepID=A0A397TCU5_9GLOM|nr:P-loop containing nucleoside triphosphate hydrolase protein [Glomus cerebriforme]
MNIRNDWKIRPYNSNTARQSEVVFKKYWNAYKSVMTDPSNRNKILTITGVGITTYYLSPSAQVRKITNVFKEGKFIQNDDAPDPNSLVKREDLEEALIKILRLKSGAYCLIVGEHGTGKTNLIRNIILKLKKPKGVVHFECPSVMDDFSKQLASHLNCELYSFNFLDIIRKWITGVRRQEQIYKSKYADWSLLSEQLINAAVSFKKKYGRPIVLILDQVDRIAKNDQEFLEILQDFAKDHADRGSIIIVFVSSEGLVQKLLKSRSAWSRAIHLEIGDISDEAAVKFLENSDVDKNIAKNVVSHLTGGRFALLQQFKNQYNVTPNIAAEEFRNQLFTRIQYSLNNIKISERHKLFTKLIELKCIDIKEAKTIIPLDILHKLIEDNIFSGQHNNRTMSFHSRYVETYFKELKLLQVTLIVLRRLLDDGFKL